MRSKPSLASFVLLLALFSFCVSVDAQQPKKIPLIGYLSNSNRSESAARSEGIRFALRERGYIEGQNITIQYRYADGKIDRYEETIGELVRLKVDILLVGGGTTFLHAVKNATKTIPVIMMATPADPVETGLVDSLARPGGNLTGISLLTRELGGKRLEILKETVPNINRIAVLYVGTSPSSVRDAKEVLPTAARALHLTIEPWELRRTDDFNSVLTAMAKQRPDGLYVTPDPQWGLSREGTVNFAVKNRLPSMFVEKSYVDVGGLMSYGADMAESYQRVAYYVDKILKGAKPGDLPVEQPTKFELVINLKTAKQIGLTIPQTVLYRADKVIR